MAGSLRLGPALCSPVVASLLLLSEQPAETTASLLAISKQVQEVTRTIYIRQVPDEVAERLEKQARRVGVPLSTFALKELR